MRDTAGILNSPDVEWSLVWVSLSDTELKKKHEESLLCFSHLFSMLAVATVSIATVSIATVIIGYADRMLESVCVLMLTPFTLNFLFRDWLSVCSVFQTLSCWRKPAWPKESWAAPSGDYTWPLTRSEFTVCDDDDDDDDADAERVFVSCVQASLLWQQQLRLLSASEEQPAEEDDRRGTDSPAEDHLHITAASRVWLAC